MTSGEVTMRDFAGQQPLRAVSRSSVSNKDTPLASPISSIPTSPSASRHGSASGLATVSLNRQGSTGSGAGSGTGANGVVGGSSGTAVGSASQPTGSASGVKRNNSNNNGNGSDDQGSGSINAGGARRPSFGLNFLSSFTNSIRSHHAPQGHDLDHEASPQNTYVNPRPLAESPTRGFMSNSPTIGNFAPYNGSPSRSTPARDSSSQTQTQNGVTSTSTSTGLPSAPGLAASASPDVENHENEDNLEESHDMDVTMVAAVAGAQPRHPDASNDINTNNNNHIGSVNEESSTEPSAAAAAAAAAVSAQEGSASSTTEPVTSSTTQALTGGADDVKDKDGYYSLRLTPMIDHSSSNTGLYFAPIIRKSKSNQFISIGRYTEKNKAAAHAPQGSNAPIVFKSKVVSRTHAMFQCNEEGQWFVKDCKSSSGTFLNHIRLSPASQESSPMPLVDGDIIQLGMDYRGGTEEVYRCVKMRCEFNKSWQRKVNQFNLEIHQKLKNLSLQQSSNDATPGLNNPMDALKSDELSECAICLLKLEPCQALFISPCSHSWHYKCIRPIIIKSYPQFYCPNCRCMCDLETDIEDDDD